MKEHRPRFSIELTPPRAAGAAVGAMLLYILVAVGVHGIIGYVGYRVADSLPEEEKEEETKVEYVEVEFPEEEEEEPEPEPVEEEEEPEPEPEPEPVEEEEEPEPVEEEEPEPEPEPVEEEEAPEPEPEPEQEQDKPPKEMQKAPDDVEVDPEVDEFTDFGAFEGSTSGVGTVEVATGSSAKGRIRRANEPVKRGKGREQEGEPEGTTEPPKPKEPKVVSRRQLDKDAKPNEKHNRRLKASYPPELKKAGLEADVVAIVTVRANGTVARVRVVNDVDKRFAEAAEKVFKKFRFSPAQKNGEAVASEVRLVYRFRLDDA